jgi:hypothetical protein
MLIGSWYLKKAWFAKNKNIELESMICKEYEYRVWIVKYKAWTHNNERERKAHNNERERKAHNNKESVTLTMNKKSIMSMHSIV